MNCSKKIKKLKKSISSIFRNIYLIKILGLWNTLRIIYYNNLLIYISKPAIRWAINEKKHNVYRRYLDKNHLLEICEQSENYTSTIYKDCIWVFWWQGLENMPKIVRKSFDSIQNNSNGHRVILICKENISNYIDIPKEIEKKVHKHQMSLQGFSDFVRLSLLYNYGGIWIDATILLTEPLSDELYNYEFYTIKNQPLDNNCVGYYRYMVFFLAAKPKNHLILNMLTIFRSYWMSHNKPLDYFLIDYCFDFLYRNDSISKKLIDNVPISNENIFLLQNKFKDNFDINQYNSILKNTQIHKLTYRVNESQIKADSFYNYLLNS